MTTEAGSRARAGGPGARDRILAVADEALSASADLSLNAVARLANVGVGTVYRHFPTPEDLVLAVYEFEVRHLVDVVPDLLREHTPPEAFRVWTVDYLAHYVVAKRGLAEALRAAAAGRGAHRAALAEMAAAVEALIRANAAVGAVRGDLDPRVVLRALAGLLVNVSDSLESDAADLVELLWLGMRPAGSR